MRNAFTLLLAISAAVLLPSTAAHAMPAPHEGTLVQPLTLKIHATPVLVAQDLPSMPDLIPSREVPATTEKPKSRKNQRLDDTFIPEIPPDTGIEKTVGWITSAVSVLALGIAVYSYNEGWFYHDYGDTVDTGFYQPLFISEAGLVSGIVGVGLLTGAYGDDAVYEALGDKIDARAFYIESHYKSAKYAAITGLYLIGGFAGTFLVTWGLGRATGNVKFYDGPILPELYLLELGLAAEVLALINLGKGYSAKRRGWLASSDQPEIGFTLVPTNGGLAAGLGMRF